MTRDRVRLTAVAAVLALAAVACGGDDGGDTAPASTTPASTTAASAATTTGPAPTTTAPATAAGAGAAPTTGAGASTTEVSAVPSPVGERLVVLAEEFMLADVLALGLQPIASTASVPEVGFQGLDPADTAGIEVLPMTTLDLEQIALLRPDTIVTLQFWADQIGADALDALGDVILVPDGLTIAERITTMGDLLGRPTEAAARVAELAAATARAEAAVPDGCTVSLAAIYSGPSPAAFVAGPWDIPTAILSTGCRLDPDPTVAEPDRNGRVYLSLEQLGLLDAPTIVLLQSETVEGEAAAVAEIESNPLWERLPAVQSGDVLTFDRLGYPGITGQIRFLDDFAAALAG